MNFLKSSLRHVGATVSRHAPKLLVAGATVGVASSAYATDPSTTDIPNLVTSLGLGAMQTAIITAMGSVIAAAIVGIFGMKIGRAGIAWVGRTIFGR